MTLILAVLGRETIWLMADRRLTSKRNPPRDDARKIMDLETTDGIALLGYAGLGATARGTEPADWMSAVLRGRPLPIEQSLGVLADAMKRQLPRHILHIPGPAAPAHYVLAPAFVNGKSTLYSIDLALTPDRKRFAFRYVRHVNNPTPKSPPVTPHFGLTGSGALYLASNLGWMPDLRHLVRASDRRRLSPQTVADHLATINYQTHLQTSDNSVGPTCIVIWRNRKEGAYRGGGAHSSYTGITRDSSTPSLPTIGSGMDIAAIANVLRPLMDEMLKDLMAGNPHKGLDTDKLNKALADVPDEPDEDLL